MSGPVHFIYLGGHLLSQQNLRAIETARVHSDEVILWAAAPGACQPWVDVRPLYLGEKLREHPIQLANVKDLFLWRILNNHGGIYLDLDTISLRPAWDLLTAGICVSREYHSGSTHPHPYNSAVVLAKPRMPALAWMAHEAKMALDSGEATWGAIGPHLLTQAVARFPDDFSIAPYRALNGWSYHDIDDYYDNPRDPGEEVRVIHLYSSDHQRQFYADRWMC